MFACFISYSVVEDKPEIHSNRIAVDTGVYQGRPLTAVKLYADEEFFIQSDIIETSHLDLVAES
jgi:hypothetical protein